MTPEEAARYNEYWDNLGNLKSTTIADDLVDDVAKYADDVADLTDDTFGSVYKNSLDDVDGFKGLNLDESSNFFKNADEVVESSLDANLLDEMANSEVKYNPDNINLINRLPSNQGYDSFKKLKNVIGSPGEGNHWHHIVEQSQIGKSGFDAQQIHNTSNIIAVNATTHTKITGYYNTTTFRFTNGLSVRDWLAGQSYEYQYEFGLDILR